MGKEEKKNNAALV